LRPIFVRLHRWVGLTLTLFLVVIGLTGAIIAWFKPLDEAVNPNLHFVQPSGERLPALELRERLEAGDPHAHVYYIHFPDKASESFSAYVEGKIDPTTSAPFDIGYDEVFANPYTGERIGERLWGSFSFHREDLISQIYFLHYSLVLPEQLGEGFMGWVAFIWAIDCFVGVYLTLPLLRRRAPGEAAREGFFNRWSKSWKIKARAGTHRRVFDIHRAVSLWVWAMLLVFAVSGFALNIPDTYASGIKAIAHYEDIEETPDLDAPLVQPTVGWQQALVLGRKYMAETAAREGFAIERPTALIYRREKGIYFYRVQSDRDVVDYGMTSVGIDGMTGALAGIEIPTGHRAGNTFTSWTMALHMAMVGGIAWKIFVSLIGLVVVMLSMTGVWIWLNKRRAMSTAN
jgi:uncharacterized iron-regulated membrane protein